MIVAVPLNRSPSTLLVGSSGSAWLFRSASSRNASSVPTICCSVSRKNADIPKLEPFSRNKIDRAVKEPPLIQKSESQIADYCLTLEGDDSHSCWRAYFELKDLEVSYFKLNPSACVGTQNQRRKQTKEKVTSVFYLLYKFLKHIFKSASYLVHPRTDSNAFPRDNTIQKEAPKEEVERLIIEAGGVKSLISCVHGVSAIHRARKECSNSPKPRRLETVAVSPRPIPDGLPKTRGELEEEEKARMPDSPLSRLLRARGRHPAWYTPAPEHETD